ncbi:uncharacterized protein OCT59_026705 [Rhizophagus irregularis]|uniref:uncharacterized protein n=1 Tax=Rhizophagus irregularis TaxID=588596 RepID=UPI0019EB8598|nr:hypothetical protein OCT59_026705 [Rhizophagus irregularis]GET50036.1 hypothetical protein RIR_jg32332.t1 [Rhizophagus irregularis DAOM 181602=DAOM 197198]
MHNSYLMWREVHVISEDVILDELVKMMSKKRAKCFIFSFCASVGVFRALLKFPSFNNSFRTIKVKAKENRK